MSELENQYWQTEDYELADEFADVISVVQTEKATPVPVHVDRKIARLIKHSSGSDVSDHWIFSQGPRLVLVMLIFFSVGVIASLFF